MVVRLLLGTLLVAPTIVIAADLESRIESVTVYPRGATVARVATAELAAGANEIRLVGLVSSITAERLQLEVANPGVRVGQVRVETEQEREAYDAEVNRVLAEIDKLTNRIQALDDSSNGARLRLRFLENIATGYGKDAAQDGARGSADVNAWRAALELLQAETVAANQLIRDNDLQKAVLQKDLSVLQRTLGDLRGGSLQTVAAAVTLTAERAGPATIRLRYYQEEATWSPLYEARLDSNAGALQLTQQAAVRQGTDEDWNNVQLTLSTSRPEGELIPPELDSEFLDLRKPMPVAAAKPAAVSATREMAADSVAQIDSLAFQLPRQPVETGNFAVSYNIPGTATVLNDADEAVTLELAQYGFDTTLVTQVVPRRSTEAFLVARFRYDENEPLFASRMAVYVDSVFAGYTQMPTALPQSEVSLPMGQDRRIAVKVESQGGEGGESGIISRRKVEATDYLFEITNRRQAPSLVEVLDLIPVARNSDIEVDVPRSATVPDERNIDDRPGLVRWRKTLGAGDSWRIRHQYTVSYPADAILVHQ